jgi:hypothetical protein
MDCKRSANSEKVRFGVVDFHAVGHPECDGGEARIKKIILV